SEPSASPIIRPKCTARSLATGRLPGRPRQTGHVCVFGGSPNDSSQPQNIFVTVASCTWISRPITGSSGPPPLRFASPPSDTRRPRVEGEAPLERVGGVEQPVLAECRAGDLQADGEPLAVPAGNRDRRNARQRHRHRAVVVEVHRERVGGLL